MECLVQVGRPTPDVAAEFQMSAEQTMGGASLFREGGCQMTSHFTLVLSDSPHDGPDPQTVPKQTFLL